MQGQESPLKTARQSGSVSYKNFSDFPEPRKNVWGPQLFGYFTKNGTSCLQEIPGPTCGVQSKYGGFSGLYTETLVLVFSGAF